MRALLKRSPPAASPPWRDVPAAAVDKEEEIYKGRPVTSCDAQTCPWKPYSNSQDFTKDAWLIFAILFFLLFLAISLNSLIRCLIRRRRRRLPPAPTTKPPPPPATVIGEGCSVVVFSGGEEERDCAICLSEFEEGERVRVLEGCKHGFHVHCIKEWLSAPHSSCPICRASISLNPSFI